MVRPEERPTAEELRALAESKENGFGCRKCGCRDFRVRNTVPIPGFIRRYRVCRYCGTVRTTYEK